MAPTQRQPLAVVRLPHMKCRSLIILISVTVCLLTRLAFLNTNVFYCDGDEAIVGLMAIDMLRGKWVRFEIGMQNLPAVRISAPNLHGNADSDLHGSADSRPNLYSSTGWQILPDWGGESDSGKLERCRRAIGAGNADFFSALLGVDAEGVYGATRDGGTRVRSSVHRVEG